jgi:NAD(P)H-dependent flavin oxidoreductase YrpB (nitropropane dioxygenase family)
MSADWTLTWQTLPAEGVVVEAMDSGGHVQRLVYSSGLWRSEDRSMYVYFTPTYWRAVS